MLANWIPTFLQPKSFQFLRFGLGWGLMPWGHIHQHCPKGQCRWIQHTQSLRKPTTAAAFSFILFYLFHIFIMICVVFFYNIFKTTSNLCKSYCYLEFFNLSCCCLTMRQLPTQFFHTAVNILGYYNLLPLELFSCGMLKSWVYPAFFDHSTIFPIPPLSQHIWIILLV